MNETPTKSTPLFMRACLLLALLGGLTACDRTPMSTPAPTVAAAPSTAPMPSASAANQ